MGLFYLNYYLLKFDYKKRDLFKLHTCHVWLLVKVVIFFQNRYCISLIFLYFMTKYVVNSLFKNYLSIEFDFQIVICIVLHSKL
ncbi:hypothetical protein FLAT13_03781 [Flavobacterium salmonis]|uniref:Uncharacterized protein n=1 Tax=Flavobacterium salmonis TaxID=2654844 RepID=A0A6V6Z6B1_9FLAO|nr:hypothetical protein FLAT13_03781 [Flavobacterium salmonis]